MAKIKMLCPFSNKPCRECPQYRGRHYYLCFCKKYRGYLGKTDERVKHESRQAQPEAIFEMPPPLSPSPKWLAFNEVVRRKKK